MTTLADRAALREAAARVRERYLPPEKWSCVVCGSPMTFGSSGPDGTKYWCKKMADEITRPYSSERMEHSIKSDRSAHLTPDAEAVAIGSAILTLLDDIQRLEEALRALWEDIGAMGRYHTSAEVETLVLALFQETKETKK